MKMDMKIGLDFFFIHRSHIRMELSAIGFDLQLYLEG